MTQFTKKQKAAHCRQLADFLDTLPIEQYQHDIWTRPGSTCGTVGCALGRAGMLGIGNLQLDSVGRPISEDISDPFRAGDPVFGKGADARIFDYYRPPANACEPHDPRELSIHRLRVLADMLDPPSDEVQ